MSTQTTVLARPQLTTALPSAEAHDDARLQRLPGVEQPLRYRLHYWSLLLRNLAGGHRLQPQRAGRALRHRAAVTVGEALRLRWHRLFCTSVDKPLPYQTNQSVGTLLYSRLFDDLGINYRHLVHARHEVVHPAGLAALAGTCGMVLDCSVRRLLRVGENRALVVLQTLVQAEDGRLLSTVVDSFLVRNLPPADLAQVPGDREAMRDLLGLRRRQPQLALSAAGVRTCWVPVADDLPRRFGEVSGDLNPVHTTRLGARLHGIQQPFLQGLGLRSLLLGPLAAMGLSLDRLAITYVAPALPGQALALVVQGARFEVHDARGQLLAYGSACELDCAGNEAAPTGADRAA